MVRAYEDITTQETQQAGRRALEDSNGLDQ